MLIQQKTSIYLGLLNEKRLKRANVRKAFRFFLMQKARFSTQNTS